MPTRPLAVAFDVLETLLDLQPLHDRFAEIGQPTHLLQLWFLRVQRDCMALTLSGDVAEFYPAARQALRTESGHRVTEEQIDHVLEAFGTRTSRRRVPEFSTAAPERSGSASHLASCSGATSSGKPGAAPMCTPRALVPAD